MTAKGPTYSLPAIQTLVRTGNYRPTEAALEGAAALGFDEEDVVACVLRLSSADFYKTMEADKVPGLWQDVYRPMYQGVRLYLKLQIARRGSAVIIQFKRR